MKLYIYDHCPFCVRARMILGLKNLAVELIPLQNDDEATPVGLIGKKAVPILDNGEGLVMPESLDIVRYVDSHYGTPILAETVRPEVENWIKNIMPATLRLMSPRFVQLKLAEFGSQGAIDYFQHKKEAGFGESFAESLAKSAEYIAQVEQAFAELEPLLGESKDAGNITLEDILLFPILRNLSCVKALHFTPNVARYLNQMAELSKVPLFSNQAI